MFYNMLCSLHEFDLSHLKITKIKLLTYSIYLPDKNVWDNIIKFNLLTWFDTTSYFYGIGKIKPFQEALKNTDVLKFISSLEKFVSDDESVLAITNSLLRQLYTME